MYPVSESYKIAINQKTRVTKMTGTITLTDKTVLDITDAMIAEGGLEITNQCVSGSDFQLGSVYSCQLTLTIQSDLNRNKFYDAVVAPIFNLLLSDGSYEQVPLGVFVVSEANRVGKTVKLTGYDRMPDLSITVKQLLSGFTIVQMLEHISLKTGIVVSQSTYDNIADLSPVDDNGNLISFTSNKNDKNTTYRDVLSYCAELCGGFAFINRLGEIEIKRFSKTQDKIIDDSIRNSSEFSDFSIQYGTLTANVYTKNKKGEEVLESENYYFLEDAATYILSDNPYISRQKNEQKREWIYENIERAIGGISYTPSEVNYLGDPALELGDMVSYTGYNTSGTTINSLVHIYQFYYRKSCKITCVGQNQSIAKANSLPGANLSSSTDSQSLLSFLTTTNIADVNIGSTKVALATFDLYVTDDSVIQVNGGLTMRVTTPGQFELVFAMNEVYYQFYPRQIITQTGYHYIPIFYMISDIDPSLANQFKVYMLSQDGGTAVIPPYQFMVSLLSQSMSSVIKEWGGKLTFKETINSGFGIGPVYMDSKLTDELSITQGSGANIVDLGLTYSFITSTGNYLTSAQINSDNAPTVIGVAITGHTWSNNTVTELKIPATYDTTLQERASGLYGRYNVIHIGENAFSGAGLEKIVIPKYVTEIRKKAFYANMIADITCPVQAIWYPDNIYYTTGVLKSITITPGVNGYGVDMYDNGNNWYKAAPWYVIKDNGCTLTIEEGVKSIGRYGLYGCRAEHLTLPSTLERLEESALYNSDIKDIYIPVSCNYLGTTCLGSCSYLTTVNYGGSQTQFAEIAGYPSPDDSFNYFLRSSTRAVINYAL